MTDVQENPTLTFDGKAYDLNELSEQAKYLVGQIQDLQAQANQTRARLDQIAMAQRGFENMLREDLNRPEPNEEGIVEPPVEG